MKALILRHKLAKLLVKLAYRIDPAAEAYKQYVTDKILSHALMGGYMKIELLTEKEVKDANNK